jgi:hypothetical protein
MLGNFGFLGGLATRQSDQAGQGAASSSGDSAAQTEFGKAKQSATAEQPTSTAQTHDKGGTDPKPAQTGGTDKKNLGAAALGAGVIDRHPQGRTLAVPNNYDRAKMTAYDQRIKDPFDRGVGIRSVQPGTTSRTNDIRNRPVNKDMVKDFAASHGGRPPGKEVDHLALLWQI